MPIGAVGRPPDVRPRCPGLRLELQLPDYTRGQIWPWQIQFLGVPECCRGAARNGMFPCVMWQHGGTNVVSWDALFTGWVWLTHTRTSLNLASVVLESHGGCKTSCTPYIGVHHIRNKLSSIVACFREPTTGAGASFRQGKTAWSAPIATHALGPTPRRRAVRTSSWA